MEVKKRGKAKIVICILLLILLAAVNYFTARPSNLLPEFFPYASYPVLTDNMEQTIPSHSAVWVEKDASVKENSIIVYEMDGAVHLARVNSILSEEYLIGTDRQEASNQIPKDCVLGVVTSHLSYLGIIAHFLFVNRVAVWAATGAILLIMVIVCIVIHRHREKTDKQKLIQLFEFYGEKYDLEDAGVDY